MGDGHGFYAAVLGLVIASIVLQVDVDYIIMIKAQSGFFQHVFLGRDEC